MSRIVRRSAWAIVAVALILALGRIAPGAPDGQPEKNSPPASAPAPIPDAPSRARAEAQIHNLFGPDYPPSQAAQRSAMGQKLLDQAITTGDDPAAQYQLLRDAEDMATSTGDYQTAMKAADELVARFQVGAYETRLDAARRCAANVGDLDAGKGLAQACLALADRAVRDDEFPWAVKAADLAGDAARRTGNANLIASIDARVQEIRLIGTEARRAAQAVATLNVNADDPEANFILGQFICLFKDDWPDGLPLLAKCADESLKSLAKRELAKPTDPNDVLALADGWWDAADKRADPGIKSKLKKHAGDLYESALPGLSGLKKTAVERRLAELPVVFNAADVHDTKLVGGDGDDKFEDVLPAPALMTGLRITGEVIRRVNVISALQPIFGFGDSPATGSVHGRPGRSVAIMAKEGYAIGGLMVRTEGRIVGIKIIFMRIGGKRLDPEDKYESDWIGAATGPGGGEGAPTLVSGDGAPVVGLCGSTGGGLASVGLMIWKPKAEDSEKSPRPDHQPPPPKPAPSTEPAAPPADDGNN